MHSALQDEDAKAGGSGATIQGGGKKKKNKNRSRGSHIPAVQSLQQRHQLLRQRLGARMRMASIRARKVATEVHA